QALLEQPLLVLRRARQLRPRAQLELRAQPQAELPLDALLEELLSAAGAAA
ncbi:unnamed protein product, partial [Prorocentrum cordatum]